MKPPKTTSAETTSDFHKPTADELLFLPLGGAGEIGMNLNLYGHAGKWLMIDLGVTFGGDETPSIEVIMPDPTFITERVIPDLNTLPSETEADVEVEAEAKVAI